MNVMMLLEMASAAFPERLAFTDGSRVSVLLINSYLTQRVCVLAQSKPVVLTAW